MMRPAFSTRQGRGFCFWPVDGVVPGLRRVAEPKEFHRFRRHAAFGEVIAGDLAAGFIKERVLPALGDLLVELEQLVLDVARLLFAGVWSNSREFSRVRPAGGRRP